MSLFGPDPKWASPRPSLRLLAVLLAAFALAFALTPVASAQEADPASAGEPAATPDASSDPPPVPETPPIPEPPPPPEPAPTPEPAASAPEPSPAPEPAPSPVEPPQQTADRDAVSHAGPPSGPPSYVPASTTFTPAAQAPAAPMNELSGPAAAGPTTAPLGWDVYDDALLAETFEDDGGAETFGSGGHAVFRGLGALGTIASPAERNRRQDANPPSRAEPMSAGGSGSGGSGPGQGPSLGLFGAAGGSGAGMALMTLLGMACAWLLLAPLPKRAFLTSTAMWRPSAYVPPIDRPG
jgi:outer membrane biosynthesis protein TonB